MRTTLCATVEFLSGRSLLKPPKHGILLPAITVIVLVKVALAALTPVSYDVVFYVGLATEEPSGGPPLPIWTTLFRSILWVWTSLPVPHPEMSMAWTTPGFVVDPSLHLLALLLKAPLLIADIVVGLLLYGSARKILGLRGSALMVSLAWFANPYSTFAVEMSGSIDIIPTLFIVAVVYLLQTRRPILASVALAIAAAAKLFGVILTPHMALAAREAGSRRLAILAYSLFPVLGVAYYLYSLAYSGRFSTVYLVEHTPVTQPITEFVLGRGSGLGYGQGAFIGLSTMAVILTYLIVLRFLPATFRDPYCVPSLVLLVYLAFLDFQLGYMLWPLPLLTILLMAKKEILVPVLATYLCAFLLAFILSDGFLTPSGYSLLFFTLSGDPPSWTRWLLEGSYVDVVLKPVLRSLVSGFILVTMLMALPDDWKRKEPEYR